MEQVPIATDQDGTIRVSGTRVTLDTIILHYQGGESAEYIAGSYPVPLADVHHVIAYYLRHKKDVDEYLEKRRLEGEELRKLIEARCPPEGIRERLMARQRAKQS